MTAAQVPNYVLPRPVEDLPDFAYANARQNLAERLTAAFGLSDPAAEAIADATLNPSAVRNRVGAAEEPRFEEIRVPGGVLLALRTPVWSRLIMPDPRNPRIGPSRRHPFAVEPGTSGEDSRFRPVPEPTARPDLPDAPELVVEIESRDHLAWASLQAARYVLSENNWSDSIKSQGVMEPVWLAATTYQHADEAEAQTVPTTIEGSSRTTAVHDLLKIVSADIPYQKSDAKFRAVIRKLNETRAAGMTAEDEVALRCEVMPALIIVGFRRHASATTTFPTALKSLVALRHVDPPKPWGAGPENESLADEVLDELARQGLITANEKAYYAGSCTRREAEAAHLPEEPSLRAARIIRLLTDEDARIKGAIRIAVTSQSTRKRISGKLLNELATALILRALDEDPAKVDKVRRYMKHAFGKVVHNESWEATNRDGDTLEKAAAAECAHAIASNQLSDPGPDSLELAVRAAYPLLVQNRLNADRGTANNDQPDRRTPSEILDTMRRRPLGIKQLAQALRDYRTDRPIRAVDDDGKVKQRPDGEGPQFVTDVYLRDTFPPKGKVRAKRNGSTPMEKYLAHQAELSNAIEQVRQTHQNLASEHGDDGVPLCEAEGIDPQHAAEWREILRELDDDLNAWSRRARKKIGADTTSLRHAEDSADLLDEGADEYEGGYDAEVDDWEDEAQTSETVTV